MSYNLFYVRAKKDTALGSTIEYNDERLGSIALCVLLIRAFINVMDLPEEVHT